MLWDFLWNASQHGRINQNEDATAEAARVARHATDTSKDVQDSVDRLALVCRAMWTLLREKSGLTEDDLANRVQELDLEDGQTDGKLRRGPKQCPECGKMNNKRHSYCLYCVAELSAPSAFDSV